MKNEKASRAMNHIDDELIMSAMTEADLRGERTPWKTERKNKMTISKVWKKWAAVAAAFVIMLSVGIFAVQMSGVTSGATIALDVNPSIEIEINSKEKITNVKKLNADAVTVIGNMDLIDVDLDVGMNAIIGSMLTNGYITTEQNSILISINSRNTSKAASLQEKISSDINTLLENNSIEASVITQSFKGNSEVNKIAADNNISVSKATLISKIVKAGLLDSNGVPYTTEALALLNVNDLKLMLESKSFTVDGVTTGGKASSGLYIGKSEALRISLEKAGLAGIDTVTSRVEIDFEDDIFALVYEVDLIYDGMEYEYEIHARTGEILIEEIKPAGADDDYDGVTAPDGAIDRSAALEIAYSHAGLSADSVIRPEIELDREGKKYVYEIEFKSGGREYEYEIDAMTGKVLRHNSERDD